MAPRCKTRSRIALWTLWAREPSRYRFGPTKLSRTETPLQSTGADSDFVHVWLFFPFALMLLVFRYVYEKLFHWLVARINKSLAPNCKQSNFIGILDIFGFEIFKQNSFEQLCINFCNEKLQQLFNEDTFKNEEAVYKSEGVAFPPIIFIDNQPVVDLIESRGGIFTILDDIVKGPGKPETKDAKFGTTMDTTFKANPVFVASHQHKGIAYTAFSINHYAGTVTYDVDMFVDKNKDSLFSDLYVVSLPSLFL
jgi:myosin heavy subunit